MIRAVVCDQHGNVVVGPYNFQSTDDYRQFQIHQDTDNRRFQRTIKLVPTQLSFEEANVLDNLIDSARTVNGYLKHFVIDGDLFARLRSKSLASGDAELLAATLQEAGEALKELVAKDRAFDQAEAA